MTPLKFARLLGLAAALAGGVCHAGAIATRADLQVLLGGAGTVETFEAFAVAPTTAAPIGCPVLDRAAVCAGQTNLVVPGVAFTFGSGGGQWNGAGYFGSPSKDLVSGAPAGQPLVIDFTDPVQAFGVDLRAFAGFFAIAAIQILDADDRGVIGVLSGKELDVTGKALFVGWEHAGGIGGVVLRQAGQTWSPIVDNLEFGNFRTAVPEPSALWLLAAGLAGLLFSPRLNRRARA
jgi:hypothetical protein